MNNAIKGEYYMNKQTELASSFMPMKESPINTLYTDENIRILY